MEKRNYNVVLQSAIGDGASITSKTFFYDWTQLPDVPYIVSFSFSSSVITFGNVTNARYASIYIDLAQSYNQIALARTGTTAFKANFVGNLIYNTVNLTNVLTAENDSNPPTYLNRRPCSNNFTVEIRNSPGAYFTLVGSYCLILSFQEV